MSFNDKYYAWAMECSQKMVQRNEKRRNLLILVLLNELKKQNKRKYTRKQYWIHPILRQRHEYGFYHAIFPVISLDSSRFRNYFRMTPIQFEELLTLVAPLITKQTVVREPISAAQRLCVTIRYLASGDSMTSISYQYLIGVTTVSTIIEETCKALWTCLQERVLPSHLSEDDWLSIAKDFEDKWNFNHCIGAIDGRHMLLQCPNNAGSAYFNYKHSHSIVLLGVCDANYMFTLVDIGSYGRRSDGGIFRDSIFGRQFKNNQMNVPKPESITIDGSPLPYILVGDNAFPLTDYLLRPYPGTTLTQTQAIFNYRLSRSRRTIENTFGILVNRWRIFRKPIICTVEKAIQIVQAVVCLHNWLRKQDIGENEYVTPTLVDYDNLTDIIPGSWRKDIQNSAFREISRVGTNNSTRHAMHIREEFAKYFNNEGAVPWQYDHC